MKKNIAIVGAFNRDNYGDIIMPILFTKYFEKNYKDILEKYKFKYYSLTQKNMEYVKGVNCMSISEISDDDSVVIVVGGDVLTSRYGIMYLQLLQNDNKILEKIDYYGRIFTDYIVKKKLKCRNIRPWIFDSDKKVIIYNTVGGVLRNKNLLFDKDKIIKKLKQSAYISVRDIETKNSLTNLNVESELCPDSVLLMSKILDDYDYNVNVNKNILERVGKMSDYFIVQCSLKVYEKLSDSLVSQIEEVVKNTGLKCVLLPIGRASGHSDYTALKKLASKLSCEFWLPEQCNVYETAYILKNAKLYCGSSLHGIITSASYLVPHMALTDNVEKAINFIKTWKTSSIIYTNEDNFCDNAIKLLNEKIDKKDIEKLQTKIIQNYEKINLILNEAYDEKVRA